MEIEITFVSVEELVKSYEDNGEGGVVGYGGLLDIRPSFQREFIYDNTERDLVIETVEENCTLGTIYWSVKEGGTYEVIDGQQRTISIAQYATGGFPYKGFYFHNLPQDKQEQFMKYKIQVNLCKGKESEKLHWFRKVNVAGKTHTEQEIRNSVFTGTWLMDAKKDFSRVDGRAQRLGKDYINGSPSRQDYLETALKWISKDPSTPYTSIEDYMGRHQHDENAEPLWNYYQSVINWISSTFTVKLEQMKKVDWGYLYSRYKDDELDSDSLAAETQSLLLDDDVQNLAGIYPYLLTRDQKHLNIRAFTLAMKTRVYAKQKGRCALSGEKCELKDMEADHIIPWSEGWKNDGGQLSIAECCSA